MNLEEIKLYAIVFLIGAITFLGITCILVAIMEILNFPKEIKDVILWLGFIGGMLCIILLGETIRSLI